jgi:hypothetical protein
MRPEGCLEGRPTGDERSEVEPLNSQGVREATSMVSVWCRVSGAAGCDRVLPRWHDAGAPAARVPLGGNSLDAAKAVSNTGANSRHESKTDFPVDAWCTKCCGAQRIEAPKSSSSEGHASVESDSE